jgi:16S rRNA (guanine966-N2)-methyltransferase
MAKEGLFNILANHIDLSGTTVLDLFSGTGGIGYEFASRGSQKVVMVEKDYVHHSNILQNIEKFGLGDSVEAIKADAFKYIEKSKASFDVVFADPPYELKGLETIPALVMGSGLLISGGWFIFEHGSSDNFNQFPGFQMMRKYGSVHFSFFKKE